MKGSLYLSFIGHGGMLVLFLIFTKFYQDNSLLKSSSQTVPQALYSTMQVQIVEASSFNKQLPNENQKTFLSKENNRVSENTVAKNTGANNTISAGDTKPQRKSSQLNKLFTLTPSEEGMALKSADASPSRAPASLSQNNSDYIEGEKTGPQTILNTREYKFYSFFSRIRTQVSQFWYSNLGSLDLAAYLRETQISRRGDSFTTDLLVTLSESGDLIRITILEPSGVGVIDNAALESFHQSAPFPNPPQELIQNSPTKTIEIKWKFVIKMDASERIHFGVSGERY